MFTIKNKTDLRKTGFFNVISLSLAIFAAVLIIFNIKLYEGRIIEGHNESNSKSTAEMTIKLINNTESAVVKNHRLGKINNSLENIKVSKHNTLELIKLLNTQIFKSMDIASIQLEVTDPNNFDQKLISVNINGGIQDRRPEAILEASNIESSLKSTDYLKNVKVDYDNYQNKNPSSHSKVYHMKLLKDSKLILISFLVIINTIYCSLQLLTLFQ